MSMEFSHEHTGQEPPRSDTLAETSHNLVVQGDSEGEQLPANVTPGDDQEVATYQVLQDPFALNEAGIAALHQYWASGQVADLNRAVECWHKVLNLTPFDSPAWPPRLNNLGTGLLERYACTGDLADLNAAISASQQAVQATPPDSPYWPTLLSNLGTGLRYRYARSGNLADLKAAISALQQAVQATSPDSPDWPDRLTSLSNLGAELLNRYARSGNLADLEAAISACQLAIQATSPDSPDQPTLLSNLGTGLSHRYARSGELADLEAAISAFQQAVQATSPDSPDQPTLLYNLSTGLGDRYVRSGDLADLDAAISASQQAVQATSPDSSDRPALLSNLGTGLSHRYARSGDPADLEAAISAHQQAVQVTPPDSPDWPPRLSKLGTGLLDRYARTRNLADLDAAIDACQQVLPATPFDSPDWPLRLGKLGTGLLYRYARTGAPADLELAITVCQQAVQASSSDSPNRSRQLGNLGAGLLYRYARSGNLADLDAAISAFQQVVQASSSDSPDQSRQLGNLSAGLSHRYARSGNLADLEAAITVCQQAVQATPLDSSDRPALLNNLGTGLRDRYARSGELADLDAAISTFQQAVQASSPDSPDQSRQLGNLSTGLCYRYARSGDLADLDAAISAWEKGWSIPHPRFAALPVTYQLGEQRQGAGIAASLITAHLERAKQRHPRSPSVPPRVLEIAEGSKSRLLTQLVGRGPLPLPVGLLPAIAAQEQQLLAELTALDIKELAIHDHFASTPEETALQRFQQPWVIVRQETLRELEDLWTGIARLGPEGAAYVALRRGATPTWQEFAHLTDTLGPATALLSFFTTTDRALLFLLRSSWPAPRLIEVPLNQAGWADLWTRFFHEVHRYQPSLRRSTTWDQPLHPLFTKAQHHLEGVERLILAPQGIGHLLPWGVLAERAGWHTSAGQPLPLVTLPALSILPRLRQRPHVPTGPALVVGDPRGDLRHAEAEAKVVAKRFGTNPLLGPAAQKSAVLARFPDATLIHLATHAFFDANNPLESGIVLADGVLTAREILQHHLQADLLVLSACESGRVGSLGGEELAGLSQAFLQTGIRSLLVSLWRVNDPATAALIQAFYTARQAGADKALALRQAMTQIQQDPRWTHPYYWGAFVLLGDWD